MARISSYKKDLGLRSEDRLIGSSYSGLVGGKPAYTTSSYTLDDLGQYFGSFYYNGTSYETLADRVVDLENAVIRIDSDINNLETSLLVEIADLNTALNNTINGLSDDIYSYADETFAAQSSVEKLQSAFLTNGNGDITGFAEELEAAVNTVVEAADFSANNTFDLLSGKVTDFLQGFILDENGFPSGFGDALLENIEGAAQSVIDLTDYALSSTLDETDALLGKVREAFTFDPFGNVANFNTILATATETKVRSVFTADGVAYGQDVDQIKNAVGTWDEEGNLLSLSSGLNSKISLVITSDTASLSTNVNNLRAGFATFDEDGIPTSFSDALQTEIQTVIAGEDYAIGVDFRGLQTVVQGEDGNGGLVYSLGIAEDGLETVTTLASSTATKTTNLAAKFGTFDEAGNFSISTSSDYFNQIITYVDEDSALASSVESLSTTVGDHTTSINTHQESIDGIEGRYGVEIDNDGRITGFQIIGGVDRSDFIINAEKFLVYNGSTNSTPFVLDSSQLKLNVPLNGVSGTFSGNLVVDKITIDDNDITIKSDVVPGDGGSVRFADSLSSVVGYVSGQEAEGYKGVTMYGLQRVNLNSGANASISMLGGSGLAHNIYVNGNLYSYDNIQTQTDLSVGGDTVLSGAVQMSQYPALNNQNGYKKLTGGTIIQWGRVLQNSVTITVTFPTAFPTACLSVTATKGSTITVATQNNACTVNQFTTSNFKIDSNDAVADHYVWWIAIGY